METGKDADKLGTNADETHANADETHAKRKRPRTLAHETVYLDQLPSSSFYEKSYMHRDVVTRVAVSQQCDFIITGSVDGQVKFWRKTSSGIEFVKHFQAHLGPLHSLVVSPDGMRLVTTSADRNIKFFDVRTFDMTSMIAVDFIPGVCVWTLGGGGVFNRIALSDKESGVIRFFSVESCLQIGDSKTNEDVVTCMVYVNKLNLIISGDKRGLIEYVDCDSINSGEGYAGKAKTSFRFKSETDLFELAKNRTWPVALTLSPSGSVFACLTPGRCVLLFDVVSGKVLKKYQDEPASAGANDRSIKDSEFDSIIGRGDLGGQTATLVYDDSGHFLFFGSLSGIKVINVVTSHVVAHLGGRETQERFLGLALYQGVPKVEAQANSSKPSGKTAEEMQTKPRSDPTVYATSINSPRFYCLSRRDPVEETRDVLNENPLDAERRGAEATASPRASAMTQEAVLRTTAGEIRIQLHAEECPRTVENFATHSQRGYYNNLVFHRVIKNCIVQTGDPLGDGTGGESIWGGNFEDEFNSSLKHLAFVVSMANCGPNTNGSQVRTDCFFSFFVTLLLLLWTQISS